MKISEFNNLTMNQAADYYYELGANVLPSDPNNPKRPNLESWKQYEIERVPKEVFEHWKRHNLFDHGILVVAGKLHYTRGGITYYLIEVDFDNQPGIAALTKKNQLEEWTKQGIVIERSSKPNGIHALFLSARPYKKLSNYIIRNDNVPKVEIKGEGGHGVMLVSPSPNADGTKRQIIGYSDDELEFGVADGFDKIIDQILNEHGIEYLYGDSYSTFNPNKITIQELFKEDTIIYQGNNRHEAVLRIIESLLKRNYGILTEDQVKQLSQEWNQKHCSPPLNDNEFEKQSKAATRYISKQPIEPQSENKDKNTENKFQEKYPELKGNIYYQINEIPEKFIIAYNQKKTVIEATVKTEFKKSGAIETIDKHLVHNKTFLACIPTKITRHKNPLGFLQTQETFSISFIDSVGEQLTFKHKTLTAIIQSLRDSGYVLSDGADLALAALVQAYRERGLIEENEDIEYIGFFKIENKIIASNMQIKQPTVNELGNAIEFLIGELKQRGYENRLDLLATSMVWGMVAPLGYIIKTNDYFLKIFDLSGFSNSTKSNTGKLILALDGHVDDRNYRFNFDRVDTEARFGKAISHSTFPIQIDELPDLNNEKNYGWYVNAIKIHADNKIFRTKHPNGKTSDVVDIPGLSCIIQTSNFGPPSHNSGYMRRIIARNFPQSESWKEDDPKAQEYKSFLHINLPRMKAFGDFRNWYIMNNQDEILKEVTNPNPLDLGLKILRAAFDFVKIDFPEWLLERLPENQLEESIQDSDVIVKRAFEKYIDEQVNRALQMWRLKLDKEESFKLANDISDRLVKLAKDNLLPDVKYTRNYEIIISKGILTELYSHGVSRDQLPDLKALADYMKARYRPSHGKMVVAATIATLNTYFDSKDEESGESGESGESAHV